MSSTRLHGQLRPKLVHGYRWANQRSGLRLGIITAAIRRFNKVRAAEAAASIAYYALFSLFPLLLLLVSLIGHLLISTEAPLQVLEFVSQVMPTARSFVEQNLLDILAKRGPVGVIGGVVLLWAASGVFVTLARNINRAWPEAQAHGAVHGRVVAVSMVIIVGLLLLVSILITTGLRLLDRYNVPIQGSLQVYNTLAWQLVNAVLPWIFTFLIFVSLYRWVPNTNVRLNDAAWGALFSTCAWQLSAWAFRWYVNSGMAQFELFYGSLGTIIGLLTWIYLGAAITLFGAHISAAVARWRSQTHPATG